MKIVIRDKYSARELTLHCDGKKFLTSVGRWDWLTDWQRKRIENYFGRIAAYHCEILYQ